NSAQVAGCRPADEWPFHCPAEVGLNPGGGPKHVVMKKTRKELSIAVKCQSNSIIAGTTTPCFRSTRKARNRTRERADWARGPTRLPNPIKLRMPAMDPWE